MVVDFHDAVTSDGLFDVVGTALHANDTLVTAMTVTVPTELDDAVSSFNLLPFNEDKHKAFESLRATDAEIATAGSGVTSLLASYMQTLIIETVHDDVVLNEKTLSAAMTELVQQMEDNAESVNACVVSVGVTPAGANVGDGVCVATIVGADGLSRENSFNETITAIARSAGENVTFNLRGEDSETRLSHAYPAGSGLSIGLASLNAQSGIAVNGGFDEEDSTNADLPNQWIADVATLGTTLLLTVVEQQTVTIAGSPTGGHYLLNYTNSDGDVQSTVPIAFNASQLSVQSALRSLDDLGSVTVTTTGTTPNYVHTIKFDNLGGDITELTSTSFLTGGAPTITHATTVAGTPQVMRGGRALHFDSDGVELTSIQQRVTLTPQTIYAINAWMICDVIPAAGELRVSLVDGVAGTVINDDQGTANQIVLNATSLTTSWQSIHDIAASDAMFRTPSVLPDLIYLRLEISTAISLGTSVFVDEMVMAAISPLYAQGPCVALFDGPTAFAKNDQFDVTVTNDYGGAIQRAFEKFFGMRALGLQLPSNTVGTETIPDTVIG